ncbi:MAG: hypothetical protein IJB97_06530, partial [Clostridia bacterium]|nr:hypothetical protein [Clostridia bacterium]
MAKRKHFGKALLSSIVAMFLTISMFVGTTFAWFTDSVQSANNIIKAGNLDITLEYLANDGTSWNDVEGSSEILDADALWEPGYTEDVYLRIKNAGSLALKYQFGVNIVSETAGVNAKGDKFLLSDYIYFDVKTMNSDTFEVFETRAEAMEIASETTLISKGYAKNGKLEANSDYVYLAMVVYMPTTVGNVANHNGETIPEINLGINVVATQVEAENDSFDNTYDKDLMVTVEEGGDLAAAIAQVVDGGTVYVEAGEYNLTSGPIVLTGKTVNVVGVGKVTLNKNYGSTHVFTVSNGATLNLENLTIDGQGNTREGVYVRWNSNVTLENVTIKNTG